MAILRIAAVALAIGFLNSVCWAENSEKLVDYCHAAKKDSPDAREAANIGYCVGYILGEVDGVGMSDAVTAAERRPARKHFCIPDEVGEKELALVYLKYMDDHSGLLHLPPAATVWRSLVSSYPCKMER